MINHIPPIYPPPIAFRFGLAKALANAKGVGGITCGAQLFWKTYVITI